MSQVLVKELENLTGAYNEEAPESASYPYIVFSAKRLSEEGGRQVYTLEMNVWDQHEFYSRAADMMDGMEKKLHRNSIMTDNFLLRFFKGRRQNVPDPDKSIKRVMEQFEMHVYERKGME